MNKHDHRAGEGAGTATILQTAISEPAAGTPTVELDYSRHSESTGGRQRLAEETAVALSYNGLNHAVMMATPEDLEDYALGFSISSGLVEGPEQILDIELCREGEGVRVEITLSQRALHALKRSRRTLVGSGGCGLCGVEALSQALAPLPGQCQPGPLPATDHLRRLRDRFRDAQRHLHRSGAVHAALYVDEHGETLLCREDIGRHNALDKLLGACLRRGQPIAAGFVAITSRCGLELVQKAVRAGAGSLVSLSSPTDISVRWARRARLNLLHQPVRGPARIYSPEEMA